MFVDLSTSLVSWFHIFKIPYSFRANRTPYKVWISEVVLQQTRVQAALDKLQFFLTTFPTVESLALATEDSVLEAFRGLGYYNRARNVRKGAMYIMDTLGGLFPTTYDELLKVPSIGEYTAGAIASICYGERIYAIDGNIKRILSRVFANENIDSKSFTEFIKVYLDYLFKNSPLYPGDINEAFMQLGQQVCLIQNPKCIQCTISKYCLSYKMNQQQKYPQRKIKVEEKLIWLVLIPTYNGRYLLHKNTDSIFLKNQWIFPYVICDTNFQYQPYNHLLLEDSAFSNLSAILDIFQNTIEILPYRNHKITKYSLQLYTYTLPLEKEPLQNDMFAKLVDKEILKDTLVSSAMLKAFLLSEKDF